MASLSTEERQQLCDGARTAAQQSYSPYSRFRVGAVVLAASGKVYAGTNVENASYGVALCAERAALAAAISAGEREFRAVAVACIDAPPGSAIASLMPCGACRQWLVELAGTAEILVWDGSAVQVFTATELLPNAFRL